MEELELERLRQQAKEDTEAAIAAGVARKVQHGVVETEVELPLSLPGLTMAKGSLRVRVKITRFSQEEMEKTHREHIQSKIKEYEEWERQEASKSITDEQKLKARAEALLKRQNDEGDSRGIIGKVGAAVGGGMGKVGAGMGKVGAAVGGGMRTLGEDAVLLTEGTALVTERAVERTFTAVGQGALNIVTAPSKLLRRRAPQNANEDCDYYHELGSEFVGAQGKLVVLLHHAKHVYQPTGTSGILGKPSPYCVVCLGARRCKVRTCKSTIHPVWESTALLPVYGGNGAGGKIHIAPYFSRRLS